MCGNTFIYTRDSCIERRKSHFKWNCCADFFCQLILVHNGLRQHFPEGVQHFVQWHFLKSNMAAATSLNHSNDHNSFCICDIDIHLDYMTIGVTRGGTGPRPPLNFQKRIPIWHPQLREIIKMAITPYVFVIEANIWTL